MKGWGGRGARILCQANKVVQVHNLPSAFCQVTAYPERLPHMISLRTACCQPGTLHITGKNNEALQKLTPDWEKHSPSIRRRQRHPQKVP